MARARWRDHRDNRLVSSLRPLRRALRPGRPTRGLLGGLKPKVGAVFNNKPSNPRAHPRSGGGDLDIKATRLCPRGRQRVRPARSRLTLLRVVMVTAVVGVLVSACSGQGAARGRSSASDGPSLSGSASAGPLALTRCMRAHGVHDYPDPDSSNFDLSGKGDLTPTNPTFQAAARTCRSLGSATKSSAPSLSPQQIAATVEFAQCACASTGSRTTPTPTAPDKSPGSVISESMPTAHSSTPPPMPASTTCTAFPVGRDRYHQHVHADVSHDRNAQRAPV